MLLLERRVRDLSKLYTLYARDLSATLEGAQYDMQRLQREKGQLQAIYTVDTVSCRPFTVKDIQRKDTLLRTLQAH